MKKIILFISAVFLISGLTGCGSNDIAWQKTVDSAIKQSSKNQKDLFILFTGSDWCPWCQKLEDEVLSKGLFKDGISGLFIPIKLDMLRKTKLPKERSDYIRRQMKKYRVQGFPTVILADSSGKPYGKTGYVRGGFKVYLNNIKELYKQKSERNKLLEKAKGLSGHKKAVVLDTLLKKLQNWQVDWAYMDLKKEILTAEKDKNSSLYKKYFVEVKLSEAADLFENSKNQDALKLLQKLMPIAADKEIKQVVYYYAAVVAHSLKQKANSDRWLKQAYQLYPESNLGKNIKKHLDSPSK